MTIQTIDDLRHFAEANFGNFGYLREIPKQLVREVDSALIVEDKVLPVHRFVLITSSPVFNEILASNPPDNGSSSSVVKIPLIGSAEQVTMMALYFMYERYARIKGEDPCAAVDVAEQLAEFGHKYDIQVVLNVSDRSFVKWLNASDASSSQATIVGLASTIIKVTKLAENFDLNSTSSCCQAWLISNFHRYPALYSELLQLRRDTMIGILNGLSKRLGNTG